MKKIILMFCVFCAFAGNSVAQTVTQAWATLASGTITNSIAIDGSGNLYVANGNSISKVTSAGIVTQEWVCFYQPPHQYNDDVIINGIGNIYTLSTVERIVNKINPAGIVTSTFATLIRNPLPLRIAVDAISNLNTANFGNSTLNKITVSTLLIRLPSFTGNNNNGINQLQWQTVTESNNKQFEIERSSNGSSFTTIGIVSGAGNNSSIKNYSFNDAASLVGTNYYRLKQIEYDGKFEYSNTIILKADNEKNKNYHLSQPFYG
jgi:hypothetical protein